MKKKPSKQTKKHKAKMNKTRNGGDQVGFTWVDRVLDGWVEVEGSSVGNDDNSSVSISIVSWNVLADSYCTRRSHPRLPTVYQNHVFDRNQRQHHIRQILRKIANGSLCPDLLALQEVDPPLDIQSCLKECGYEGHHTPMDPSGKCGRVDSCALYYRRDTWKTVNVEPISLDDIATMSSRGQGTNFHASTRASLEGITTSFLRKNMALLVKLQHLETGTEVVVATVHLFWNPMYQEVKLCQSHYVATRAKAFADSVPVLFVGDTNSRPGSAVHEYFWRGRVNARKVAPWYNSNPFRWENDGSSSDEMELASKLQDLTTAEESDVDSPGQLQVRYMLDFTLNRLCRWLRILGIDAGLETDEEERMRTKDGNYRIFERCRIERRTLVTSSSKILVRKDCPPGTYRLDTKACSNLELSLVHLLLSHGVKLEPKKFLSICVVCGGSIHRVRDKDTIEAIFSTHKAPEKLNHEDLEVFQCCGCQQGYWYDERPTSSASRVKNQATKLLKMCIQAGVSIDEDLALFGFIDKDQVRAEANEKDEICRLRDQRPDILDWMEQEDLQNPLGRLRSAYEVGAGEEKLAFTNVTSDFVGHLDYIFHDSRISVERRLWVPTTFEELGNASGVWNGHLLPSSRWPSDHLAIGAVLRLPSRKVETKLEGKRSIGEPPASSSENSKENSPLVSDVQFCLPLTNGTTSVPFPVPGMPPLPNQQQHNQRCDCGCVPNVLSLFEMAELRKKNRAAARK